MSQESPALTGKQVRAALLVAEDELTNQEIGDQLGVARMTVERWKKLPAFDARVQQHIAELGEQLSRYHIARKDKRVAAMNERWLALQQVIHERACDGTMPAHVPGVETGHVVRTYKGKDADVEEFVIDTGLLAELRNLEKQAAQEAGQWNEKAGADVADLSISFTIKFDRRDEDD